MENPTIEADARNEPPRPIITVNNVPLDGLRGLSLRAIKAVCEELPKAPPIVSLGTALKRPQREGCSVVLADCDAYTVRHVLSEVALWQAVTENGAKWVFPPVDLARDLLISPWQGIPVCDGVVNHPVLTAQGLRCESGYDALSSVWIAGASMRVPESVGWGDVQEARAVLDDLFADFPFVSDSDRAHLYALMLTAIVRRIIQGPVPMFVSEAPTPGSGKSLMLEVAAAVLVGGDVLFHAMPKYEDERAKALPVWAKESELVLLDNVDGHLQSPYLEMMLTAPSVGYRVLGQSAQLYFPMRAIVALSGNNVTFDKPLYRRCVFIQIDPKMESPETRTGFQIPNIKRWAVENRATVLDALLTIVQAWSEKGKPRSAHVMGSYEEWAATLGGILGVIGLGDAFLGNREALRAEKVADDQAVREFVGTWLEKYGTTAVPVRKLFVLAASAPALPPGMTLSGEQMREREEYEGLLGDLLTGAGEAGQRKSFGLLLKRFAGRVFGGHRIEKFGRSNGDTLWRLQGV